jgi:hypothetical protein
MMNAATPNPLLAVDEYLALDATYKGLTFWSLRQQAGRLGTLSSRCSLMTRGFDTSHLGIV